MNVLASGDITALATPTISNVATGNLTGTGGNNSVTLTGAQLDAIIVGSGTINLGAGTSDTINLMSTSTDLNTLGTANASIQGVEAISGAAAAAGVTITLSGQIEGFTITGSGSGDTITGGTGADTISAGGGNDTINLADGQFASGESIDGGSGTDTIVLTNRYMSTSRPALSRESKFSRECWVDRSIDDVRLAMGWVHDHQSWRGITERAECGGKRRYFGAWDPSG